MLEKSRNDGLDTFANCTIVSYLIYVVCVVVCGSSKACLIRRNATLSIRFARKARCENRFWHALKSEYLQNRACLTRHSVIVVILKIYDSASFGEKVAAVECRMSNVENGQKNALNPVKSPFSAYLM